MRDRSRSSHCQLVFSIGILLGSLLIALASTVAAQSGDDGWSTPVKLYEGQGSVREPALVADQTGALHAFWTYSEEESPSALFYARWDAGAWTQPVDVVAMPGVLQGPSAVVDQFGRIHLIWQGPGNALFYSSADVVDATTATGWTSPASMAQSNPHAHIVIDVTGTLHIIYPALVDGGIYYMSSVDGGQTWTSPTLVANPVRVNATSDFTRLAVAPNGDLHVVWTELTLPSGWPPLGVFYAQSTDSGLTWSEPVEMASDGYLEANIVTVDENEVHVVWNAMGSISGRYHKWSGDRGATWSETSEFVSRDLGGGSTGPPGLTVDSIGDVHVVVNTYDTVQRTGTGEFGAALYSVWSDSRWLPLVNISSTAPDYISINNEESVIAVIQGNQLHVLFFGDETHSLWHTSFRTSVPQIAPTPFASSSSGQSVPEVLITPTPSPTSELASAPADMSFNASGTDPSRGRSTNTAAALILGVLPAMVVVVGVVLFMLTRQRSR